MQVKDIIQMKFELTVEIFSKSSLHSKRRGVEQGDRTAAWRDVFDAVGAVPAVIDSCVLAMPASTFRCMSMRGRAQSTRRNHMPGRTAQAQRCERPHAGFGKGKRGYFGCSLASAINASPKRRTPGRHPQKIL